MLYMFITLLFIYFLFSFDVTLGIIYYYYTSYFYVISWYCIFTGILKNNNNQQKYPSRADEPIKTRGTVVEAPKLKKGQKLVTMSSTNTCPRRQKYSKIRRGILYMFLALILIYISLFYDFNISPASTYAYI